MTAFLESDRVQIRQYLGYSGLWLQADPRLESAITNIQAISDGGTRPDNSTQVLALAIVATLQGIDTRLSRLAGQVGTTAITAGGAGGGSARIDTVRETARLNSEGRKYVHRLARILDTEPRADVFSAAPEEANAYPSAPFGGRSGY